MNKVITLAALVGLSACASMTPDPKTGELNSHIGGNIYTAINTIAAWEGPVVLSNHYASAGTYWLGHQNACIVRGSTFTFHQPSFFGLVPWSQEMLDHSHEVIDPVYRGDLREWYYSRFGKSSISGVHLPRMLTGEQVVAMGGGVFCDD